ncbi:uncharacterized protein LOC118435342 isoform X2 [Folsomia candida]|uniref:Uncharacterized protein n=1 Tax=Folsomia candida TaxID=158441 RepID=A0A226EH27_FOLCA|nr:uncharacterized protein LOC118435342 isoform X2 [Folsomia candida]OXA56580.1 hypothetical protein Fcan01_09614 [Folsomia candida]
MMDTNDSAEELSKKSYEVVVHLNAKALSDGNSSNSDISDDDDEGRPVCNTWKGKNHELHVIGNFESDFIRRLKLYQIPPTVPLTLDPFCRVESNYPSGEPLIEDAFLLWEHPQFSETLFRNHNLELKQKEPSEMPSQDECDDAENSDPTEDYFEDSCSETEPEIGEYIQSQRRKKEAGENVTGESLIFDEDYDIVRNLHAASFSLTSYGGVPDERMLGKTKFLFGTLTEEEKCMLRVAEDMKPQIGFTKAQEEKKVETGSGDFDVMRKM